MKIWTLAKAWLANRLLGSIGYEAATRGRRGDGWNAKSGAADDVGLHSLPVLRDRSRSMVRNHWAATRAIDVLTAHIVGAGIVPSCRSNEDFAELLKAWARPQAQVGTQKGQSLGAVQRLVCRTVIESGSAIVVRQWRTREQMRERGLVMPFQIAVLEPEFLDTRRDGPRGDNTVLHGIEYDATDWPVAYWLHRRHPGSVLRLAEADSIRVPASEVAHVYWQKRAGQTIGIPWFHAVLLKMRDFDEYEDAQLMRQKIAAMFAAFIRTQGDDTVSRKKSTEDLELVPGRVQWLDIGEDVEFSDPPEVAGYGEFSTISLRSIAAGIGVTYEDQSGDYSHTNFSSARMGSIINRILSSQWQNEMMIGQLCQSLDMWAHEGAEVLGVPADHELDECQWTPPRRELIDPSREVGAIERAINIGLTSRQEEVRKTGRNVEDVDDERKKDAEREARLGLSSTATGPEAPMFERGFVHDVEFAGLRETG